MTRFLSRMIDHLFSFFGHPIVFCLIVCVTLIGLGASYRDYRACKARGGVPVEGIYEIVCLPGVK